MLMNLKQMLEVAEEHDFTVGAYNVTESSMFRAVTETAERLHAPAVIAAATNEFAFAGSEFYTYVVKRLSGSDNPFVLHLDHAHTFQECVQAVQAGFTSVMIDGSLLPYEENVELLSLIHIFWGPRPPPTLAINMPCLRRSMAPRLT